MTSVGSAATAAANDTAAVPSVDPVAIVGATDVHVVPVALVEYCSTYVAVSAEYELLATMESAAGEKPTVDTVKDR